MQSITVKSTNDEITLAAANLAPARSKLQSVKARSRQVHTCNANLNGYKSIFTMRLLDAS